MRGNKELPTHKLFLRMIAKREKQFNPMDYLKKDFLKQYPHLREPRRHIKSKKICLYN